MNGIVVMVAAWSASVAVSFVVSSWAVDRLDRWRANHRHRGDVRALRDWRDQRRALRLTLTTPPRRDQGWGR